MTPKSNTGYLSWSTPSFIWAHSSFRLMPSTLTRDCHLPLAQGEKHRQKCKSGNPPPLQAQRPQEENSQICLWRGKRSTESQPSTSCVGSTPQNQLCYVEQRKKQGKEGRLSFFWWEECYDPLQVCSVFTSKSVLQRMPGVSGLGSLLFGDFFKK